MTILNQRSEQWGQRNESKLEVTNTEMAGSLVAPNVKAPFRGFMSYDSLLRQMLEPQNRILC